MTAICAMVLLTLGLAHGDDSDQTTETSETSETSENDLPPAIGEMVIPSDVAIERTRAELDREIRDLGYHEGESRRDRVVYRPVDAWKPSIVIHDEGFVWIRRSPPRFEPWIDNDAPIGYLSCIPPFTPLCIKIQGVLVSERRLQHQKTDISEAIEPRVSAWREAVAVRAMRNRVLTEVPEDLHMIWTLGTPMGDRDIVLMNPAERRAEILSFWSSRTCTPQGQAVRDVVVHFLRQHVQTSDTPLSEAEVREANLNTTCNDALPWPLRSTDPAG